MFRPADADLYIPVTSVAHPSKWLKQEGEEDPAVAAGLMPSPLQSDLGEDQVLCAQVDTLDGVLSRQDAVHLVSLLTTPYIAIPLLLEFVCQERMLSAMLHPRMQVREARSVSSASVCIVRHV